MTVNMLTHSVCYTVKLDSGTHPSLSLGVLSLQRLVGGEHMRYGLLDPILRDRPQSAAVTNLAACVPHVRLGLRHIKWQRPASCLMADGCSVECEEIDAARKIAFHCTSHILKILVNVCASSLMHMVGCGGLFVCSGNAQVLCCTTTPTRTALLLAMGTNKQTDKHASIICIEHYLASYLAL